MHAAHTCRFHHGQTTELVQVYRQVFLVVDLLLTSLDICSTTGPLARHDAVVDLVCFQNAGAVGTLVQTLWTCVVAVTLPFTEPETPKSEILGITLATASTQAGDLMHTLECPNLFLDRQAAPDAMRQVLDARVADDA